MAALTLTKVTLLYIKRIKKKIQIDFKSTFNKQTYLFRHTIPLISLSLSTKRFAFKSNFVFFLLPFFFFRFQFEINMSINKSEIDLPFLLFFIALHTLLSLFLSPSFSLFYFLSYQFISLYQKSLTFFYCF